ncbi:MAG: hypothetical protein K8R52_11375, partial [Bacteroidales bacterium]|nr:hypothetical protein [Bacteroidales bacterium]
MKNRKVIVVVCLILNSFLLYAQESDSPFRIVPMAPETSAILQFGKIEMNLAKGIPLIEIPIYELKVDDIDIPISISYDASGIKVNDIASCVGLKWSLNTGGMIGRNIIGEADEMTADGYFNISE